MHIVEKISSILRCEPQKPDIPISFVPTCDKYITIFNAGDIPSLTYDYFEDALYELTPHLKEKGYVVYHLKSQKDKSILWTSSLEDLTLPQMNYVIRNSDLHICTDAYTNEVAGIFGTPIINMVGNRYVDNFYAWWSKEESNMQGLSTKKPSFASSEKE